jgi:hypothetical protein
MPLRVAPCPRCANALVFGERQCRQCGQTFQYGQPEPPIPTFAQIVEALQAVGVAPPAMPPPAILDVTPLEPEVPQLEGLDTGRFQDVGNVGAQEVPGLVDSTLFKQFTDTPVHVQRLFDLDEGRFDEVGAVAPAFTPGLEVTPNAEVGDVFVQPVDGLFRSDIFASPGDVVAGRVDGFEPSPAQPKLKASASTKARKKGAVPDDELARVVCRCSEIHRLPRCPVCGTPHPDRA